MNHPEYAYPARQKPNTPLSYLNLHYYPSNNNSNKIDITQRKKNEKEEDKSNP
jgi:hypothetical protein